jgi:acetoin utilization deacetylase AcuC-like enzyme
MPKYAALRARVLTEGIVRPEDLIEPERASTSDLHLVHTPDYVARVLKGELSDAEIRRLGFPWSPALAERSLRSVGGTVAAARRALEAGVAINLAGGTHHAFADHGEGFCVFNDVAVAIRVLQHERRVRRAAVIDLDVHQGNGTHAIFASDRSVHTFSMHGQHNYPFRKCGGSRDIELPDGTGDGRYLTLLAEALPDVITAAAPDLVAYVAGADPHEGDRLGRLALTFDGLARRDTMVLEACREVGIPVVITIGGGYGRSLDDTVQVHVNTTRIAATFA